LPFIRPEIERPRLKVDPDHARARGRHAPRLVKTRNLAEKLFAALVHDDAVRGVYTAARSRARSEGRGTPYNAIAVQRSELMGLPWEFLYREPSFLAQSVWRPIVRYLDLDTQHQPLNAARPLRILGMVSSPEDDELAILDVAQKRQNLAIALNLTHSGGHGGLAGLDGASRGRLWVVS